MEADWDQWCRENYPEADPDAARWSPGAASIRRELGEGLARDADAQAREPELQGAELDAEIDRLTEAFPEQDVSPERRPEAGPAPDYYTSVPGSAEHRATYAEGSTAAAGAGLRGSWRRRYELRDR